MQLYRSTHALRSTSVPIVGGKVSRGVSQHLRRAAQGTGADKSAETLLPVPSPEFINAGPPPKKFTPQSDQMSALAGAALGSIIRLGSGIFTVGYNAELAKDDGRYTVTTVGSSKLSETSKVSEFARPVKTLELYEFEGCPFCKKVREAITMLDLDVLVYPCPKGGVTWRPRAMALGGKAQFPMLVDPNRENKIMYESDDIIEYLFKEYGGGTEVPLGLRLGAATTLSCALALAPRMGSSRYTKSLIPEKPLTVWLYEGSPFCKLVREVLCELELPYLQRTCGRGSAKRQELFDKQGTFQAPYLEDPNARIFMFESASIIEYLRKTYAVA